MLVLRWNQRAHYWFLGRPKGHIRGPKGLSALWKRPSENPVCILSVVRVGHLLAICEVLFRRPLGAERNKHQKPCRLLIDSIAKVTYWPRFLLNAYGERHRGTGNLRLHTYKDSSEATSRCQREKLKTVHTASKNWCSAKSRSCVLHKHLPGYKLFNVQMLFQSLF